MQAVTNETLAETEVKFSEKNACCVIMASKGYPTAYEKGFVMTIPETIQDKVFVAGASLKEGKLVTNGGRVLGVTAISETLENAIDTAYSYVKTISFDNAYYRNDIGQRALAAKKH